MGGTCPTCKDMYVHIDGPGEGTWGLGWMLCNSLMHSPLYSFRMGSLGSVKHTRLIPAPLLSCFLLTVRISHPLRPGPSPSFPISFPWLFLSAWISLSGNPSLLTEATESASSLVLLPSCVLQSPVLYLSCLPHMEMDKPWLVYAFEGVSSRLMWEKWCLRILVQCGK